MDDFMQGKVPTIYGITYGYNGNDAPGSELTFGMAGVYAQDVWSLTPNFRLTYGLRLDMPIYMNSLDSNKSIEELAFVFLSGRRRKSCFRQESVLIGM